MSKKSSPFGLLVRESRTSQGISLRHLADLCMVSSGHLSKIETGDITPEPDLVRRMADSLNQDIDHMFSLLGQIDPEIVTFILDTGDDLPRAIRRVKDFVPELRHEIIKNAASCLLQAY